MQDGVHILPCWAALNLDTERDFGFQTQSNSKNTSTAWHLSGDVIFYSLKESTFLWLAWRLSTLAMFYSTLSPNRHSELSIYQHTVSVIVIVNIEQAGDQHLTVRLQLTFLPECQKMPPSQWPLTSPQASSSTAKRAAGRHRHAAVNLPYSWPRQKVQRLVRFWNVSSFSQLVYLQSEGGSVSEQRLCVRGNHRVKARHRTLRAN